LHIEFDPRICYISDENHSIRIIAHCNIAIFGNDNIKVNLVLRQWNKTMAVPQSQFARIGSKDPSSFPIMKGGTIGTHTSMTVNPTVQP
jgi:hypothetical protein